MGRHSNDSLKIHTTDDAGAIVLGGITRLSSDLGTQTESPRTGDPFVPFVSTVGQQPVLGFETECIKTVLDDAAVGLSGKCILSDGSRPGVVAYMQQHSQCGPNGRTTGATHKSVTISNGHLLLGTLTATPASGATITLDAHGTTVDDVTSPVAIAYNASLPAGRIDSERFAMGVPRVAGLELDLATRVAIDFAPQANKPRYAGSLWPKLVDISKVQTVISIDVDDTSLVDAAKIPATGKTALLSNSKLRFIRMVNRAEYAAFGDLVHMAITFSGMVYIMRNYDASGDAIGTSTVQIVCSSETAGAAPLSFSFDVAYDG